MKKVPSTSVEFGYSTSFLKYGKDIPLAIHISLLNMLFLNE
jgi:hypothetical protein